MPIVSAGNGSPLPTVAVRPSGQQVCIAFNAPLATQHRLANFSHVLLDLEGRRVTFIFAKSKFVGEHVAYALRHDGGEGAVKGTAARAVYVSRRKFPNLVPGRYVATREPGRLPRLSILCEPDLLGAPRLDSYDRIPAGTKGVYALFGSDDVAVDIGHSVRDVRRRVADQWELHKPASVSFVPLPRDEAKHWERVFHKRHKAEHATLPMHNPVIGPGCGCSDCDVD